MTTTARQMQAHTQSAPSNRIAGYQKLVLGVVPQVLSSVDGNPHSPTYGCFDRAFWHYRTMTDYAAPIHQEGVLTLAIVVEQEDDGNPYFGSQHLFDLCVAGMQFWCQLQRRDGSFDEFYPYERSFVATAFTAYAISETLRRLEARIHEDARDQIIAALSGACDWLNAHRDVVVVNHTAGAIAAMQNVHLLTGERRFADYREAKIEDLLQHQHEEGWGSTSTAARTWDISAFASTIWQRITGIRETHVFGRRCRGRSVL